MNLDYFCHAFKSKKNTDRIFNPVCVNRKFALGRKLRLCWVPGLLPGGETAQQGGDADESVLQQGERRTGAGFLRRSGAVGDNPVVLIQFGQAGGQFVFWNIDRAGNVLELERFGAAHIQEYRIAVLEGL